MAFIRKDGGPLDWVSVAHRKNREPTDDSQKELSYKGLLWELNLVDDNYNPGHNNGGSNNYYKGQYTSVTDDEDPSNNGPWYVTYSALDKNTGTGKYKFEGHIDDNTIALKSYYADRIVLRQELDYALDKNYVNKYQLGTYYTGVGLWWDSWNTAYGGARTYVEANKEVPDGTYFATTTYSEIFNDYTYNKATGNYAHAEGYHTYVVNSNNSHAEGESTFINSSENAHAEGMSTVIDSAYEAHVEGNSTKAFIGAHSSHAEGTGSYTKGMNAHAENSAYANGINSHAGGEATAGGESSFAHGKKDTLASGAYSAAFNYSFAYGDYSFTEGSSNLVEGSYSHAEGENNVVKTAYSHSEGKSNYVNSEVSHAEGCYNYVDGLHSHVEGHHNVSYADDTHVEGIENKIIGSDGFYSHIEGSYNIIKSNNSHSEGTYNIVNGTAGHAEGFTNNINNNYAHSEGANNVTNGVASHTEGYNNYTYNNYEHAQGKWNNAYTPNTHNGTLHTIGDGTDAASRHNVVSIFNDGEIDVDSKNNVYINATNDISAYSNTLHITSPSAIFTLDSVEANSDNLHYHVTNDACIKGKNTYFKGSLVTYIGKDAEGEVSNNTYITGSTKTEYINGISEETTKGKKTIINNGGLSIANNDGHDVTINTTGPVTITTKGSVTKDTTGQVKDIIKGSLAEEVTLTRTTTIGGKDTQNHNNGLTDITTGIAYYYTTQNKVDSVKGDYNVRIDGTSGKSVGGDDNLDVEENKITNVTKNYRLSANSTYVESVHTYIGAPSSNEVTGNYSISIGSNNIVNGHYSTSIGENNYIDSKATYSLTIGRNLTAYNYGENTIGIYNKSYSDGILEVGVGNENKRQNAFTVLDTGVTYFHYQPYAYDSYINSITIGNGQYSSSDYPDESPVVSLSYYNLSYKGLYDTTVYAITKINSVDTVQTLDSISRSYTTNTLNYTSGHYDKDTEQNVPTKHTIVQNSATKELAGLMSGEDKVRSDDIEDRLNAKVNSANLPTFSLNSITWKVYNNDKSYLLATYTNETSITAEYGSYVTADNYTIKMNLASNYDAAFLASVTTKGSFTMPDKSSFSPIAGGSAVMDGVLSLPSTYITTNDSANPSFSKNVASTSQTVSAIRQFGLQYLTTRTLANGNTQVYRINDPDTYEYDKNSFNVKVSGAFGIIRWYGTTDTNPASFPSAMTQEALESYMTGQKNSDKINSKSLTYAGKTDTSHKYFFYVYRKALTAVKSVQSVGANATGWFNTSNQKTITITRTTTGMKEDYYLIYTMNENGLSKGDTLTFS